MTRKGKDVRKRNMTLEGYVFYDGATAVGFINSKGNLVPARRQTFSANDLRFIADTLDQYNQQGGDYDVYGEAPQVGPRV